MAAVARKDLAAIAGMFTPDAWVQDPVVGRVQGRDQVVEMYRGMFAGAQVHLELKRFYDRGASGGAQEFELVLRDSQGEETRVDGVDLFEFEDGLISSIRAYLDTLAPSIRQS